MRNKTLAIVAVIGAIGLYGAGALGEQATGWARCGRCGPGCAEPANRQDDVLGGR